MAARRLHLGRRWSIGPATCSSEDKGTASTQTPSGCGEGLTAKGRAAEDSMQLHAKAAGGSPNRIKPAVVTYLEARRCDKLSARASGSPRRFLTGPGLERAGERHEGRRSVDGGAARPRPRPSAALRLARARQGVRLRPHGPTLALSGSRRQESAANGGRQVAAVAGSRRLSLPRAHFRPTKQRSQC